MSKPIAAGKSSFELVDADGLFKALNLKEDTVFLDLACGQGAYALAASEYIGVKGRIVAVDLWEDGIATLQNEASHRGIDQLEATVVDVSQKLPLSDNSVDVCLMATVLHDLIEDNTDQTTLREVQRVLKDQSTLAIIEFKKIDGPPGPPIAIRLSPEACAAHLKPFGFKLERHEDLGPYNYLAVFTP